ncbi:hypothetical protein HMPREF9103_02293, partial [Lentilactobacillus parafarraginis F0439]
PSIPESLDPKKDRGISEISYAAVFLGIDSFKLRVIPIKL